MAELTELFDTCIRYGMYVRKNNLDGLLFWNNAKKIIQENPINFMCGSWITHRNIPSGTLTDLDQIYDYVHNTLKMYGEEGDDELFNLNKDTWGQYHFFLQLARIPKNNPDLNLIRLLQVSYNIGQLLALRDKYSVDALEYFINNKLESINSYTRIDKCEYDKILIKNINDNIIKIMSPSTQSAIGGGQTTYYKKYKKYKAKYLEYKKLNI